MGYSRLEGFSGPCSFSNLKSSFIYVRCLNFKPWSLLNQEIHIYIYIYTYLYPLAFFSIEDGLKFRDDLPSITSIFSHRWSSICPIIATIKWRPQSGGGYHASFGPTFIPKSGYKVWHGRDKTAAGAAFWKCDDEKYVIYLYKYMI